MNTPSRTPILAANWKMHKTQLETRAFFEAFLPLIKGLSGRDVVIAPAFTALPLARDLAAESQVSLAGQNMHWEKEGAFTGEISPLMLRDLGVQWVILGHSERRHIFGETNEGIAIKVRVALSHDLHPILCVGERLEEREANRTMEVLEQQLTGGLEQVRSEEASRLVVAYEPVWAIGTGKTATPDQAQEAHTFIRSWLAKRFDQTIAAHLRILYGGSVKPENVNDLMAERDIDGALVGGASLDPEAFGHIVSYRTDI